MSEAPRSGSGGLSIGRASAINTLAALVGKSLSFVATSVLIAILFGVDARTDAFFLGLLLPLWLQQSITYGIHSCLLPVLGAAPTGDVARLAGGFFRRVSVPFLVGVSVLVVAAPSLVGWAVPAEVQPAAIAYARAMFVVVGLSLPGAVLAAMAYARRAYLVPALAQVATGVGLVVGLALGARDLGLWSLVAGYALGVVLQLATLTGLRRTDARSLLAAMREGDVGIETDVVLRRLLPVFLGAASYPLFLLATRWQASLTGGGAVSALELALRIVAALSGVVASAVALAAVPRLSALAASGGDVAMAVGASVRALCIVLLPAAATLAICGRAVVELVYHHGAFASSGADLVARLLPPLAVCLVLEPLTGGLVQLLFSRGETWRLLTCTTTGMVVGMVSLLPLANVLGIEGVAWAIAVSQAGQLAALVVSFAARARPALLAALRAYAVLLLCAALPAVALFQVRMGVLRAAEARALPELGVWLAVFGAGLGFVGLVLVSWRGSVHARS